MKNSILLFTGMFIISSFGCDKFDELTEPSDQEIGPDDGRLEFRTTNTYPLGNGTCTTAGDYWGMIKKQCTSYAAWKMNENFDNSPTSPDFPFKSTMNGGSGTNLPCTQNSGALSHACRWAMRLADYGYYVSTTPTPGSIAHWGSSEQGAGSFGHVAYVESVNSNNTTTISEYNWSNECAFGNRYNVSAPRYIRFNRIQITSSISVNPTPIVQGQGVSIIASLKNNFSESFTTDVRCALYTSNNVYVGNIQVYTNQTFSGNQTKSFTFNKSNISSNPGSYKIWIETKVASGSPWTLVHKPNATSTVNVNIVASSQPDLTVLSPSAPASAHPGSSVSVSCSIKNSGYATAASSMLRYYLSTNNSWSTNDIQMDSDPVLSLTPGSTSPESESFYIPSNLPLGTWYILFKADADGQVSESSETNNVAYKQIQIN